MSSIDPRCPGRTRTGTPCTREPVEGRHWCHVHDPEALRARQSAGGRARSANVRAARERVAAQVAVTTLSDLREVLLAALRIATVDGDAATMIAAVRAGAQLFELAHAADFVRWREELLERFPTLRDRLGGEPS